jgi:hypothetical protein
LRLCGRAPVAVVVVFGGFILMGKVTAASPAEPTGGDQQQDRDDIACREHD